MNLNEELIKACERRDLTGVKKIVSAGADVNCEDKWGESIFSHLFVEFLNNTKEAKGKVSMVKSVLKVLIKNGFDMQKHGLDIMHQFVHLSNLRHAFFLTKFMLDFDLGDNVKKYEELLMSIGFEESHMRVCENKLARANMLYAMYEIVEAKMEKREYAGTELYQEAVGKRIENVLYFSEKNDTIALEQGTQYNSDIGILCEGKLLVITTNADILIKNEKMSENSISLPDFFGSGFIGALIEKISFKHKKFWKGKTEYTQPIVNILLDNGKTISFTDNFGEVPKEDTMSRFEIF